MTEDREAEYERILDAILGLALKAKSPLAVQRLKRIAGNLDDARKLEVFEASDDLTNVVVIGPKGRLRDY